MRLRFTYNNWRREIRERIIIPYKIWFGESSFHQNNPQWFIEGSDLDRVTTDLRNFAIGDILGKVKVIEEESDNTFPLFTEALEFILAYHDIELEEPIQ